MSLLTDLKEAIRAFLLTKCPRVYHKRADSAVAFRYLVFDLPNAVDSGELPEVFVLDVDGWDDEADPEALDTLMESVDGDGDPINPTGLNRATFHLAGKKAQVYRESRSSPPVEDEPRLQRRRLSYQVRVY